MGKRILLVDDDPVIRMLVSDCLSAYGHTVEQATSGQECIDKLPSLQADIIILDLIMPDYNGLQVLEKIRNNGDNSQIPVILLSANEGVETWAAEQKVSADLYLQKPFRIEIILEAVNMLR